MLGFQKTYIFLICLCSCLCLSAPSAFAQSKNSSLYVDIGLVDNSARSYLRANQNYWVHTLDNEDKLDKTLMQKQANKDTLIRFSSKTNQKLVIASEPDLATSSQTLLLTCSDKKEIMSDCIWTLRESLFVKKAKKYRGAILIKASENDFTVINRLDIEDYLKGVVPSEMPSSWHKEALKAQSVAARTYTVSKLNRRKNLGYDLKPTVEDQVYHGYNHEKKSTNQAIKETEGLILVDAQKNPVEAYFFSQAGFATASASDIWGIEHHAYLRPQHYIDNPSFWQKNFKISELSKKLSDLQFTTLKALTVLNQSPEGRVNQVLVSGLKDGQLKHIKLSGEELRHKLGLRSTLFSIRAFGDFQKIGFTGKGFGHGIGMSQYGAKKQAQEGKRFKEILNFYYSKADLVKL